MKTASETRSAARARFVIKRVYAPPEPTDGLRVLVDALWPRGLRKNAAKIDMWAKDVAPSAALRRWFHHEPALWDEFRQRYQSELQAKESKVDMLRSLAERGCVTLLFGACDIDHNNAVVLRNVLERHH